MTGKHICYILSQFPETHETFVAREISALRQRGVRLRIISLKPCHDRVVYPPAEKLKGETVYLDRMMDAGIVLHTLVTLALSPGVLFRFAVSVVVSQLFRPAEFVRSLAAAWYAGVIRTLFKKERFGHIHAHWANVPATTALLLSEMSGVPFSFTAHAWDIFLADRLMPLKLRRTAFVATCTAYNKAHLERTYSISGLGQKLHVNYHGLETEELAYREPKQPSGVMQLFSIGRLVEQKGFIYLIEACGILARKGVAFECIIAGDGPLKPELEASIRENGLEGKVVLAGLKKFGEIRQFFADADAFVLPCVIAANGDRDGIPNVLLEAAALGVPMISTGVSGVPELVRHGETGLVTRDRDAVSLADTIIMLRDMPGREEMTMNARRLVERNFDIDRNIGELTGIFSRYIQAL